MRRPPTPINLHPPLLIRILVTSISTKKMSAGWRIYLLAALTLLLLMGRLLRADRVRVSFPPLIDPLNSFEDFMVDSNNYTCSCSGYFSNSTGVIEGDEVTLQMALLRVHKYQNYAALLFYASWCPFSGIFKPSFFILSSIFPSIPHFAIEESAVRPSILAKYGIHGFPTLVLLNSTMRMQYHGSRTLDSIISFYSNITGLKMASPGGVSLDAIKCSGYHEKHKHDQETCPFPWAKSPENLLQQETYLALATIFVVLRLLHFTFQTLKACPQFACGRYIVKGRLRSLMEKPVVYFNRGTQLFISLKKPRKNSNVQKGAKNAKVWASKSLVTVSLGDASSSHDVSLCQ